MPGSDFAETPAWSPDSTQVAFVSDLDYDIHVADLATGTVRTLTYGWSRTTWSPDGREIAYRSFAPGYNYACCGCVSASGYGCVGYGIYVMNAADGSERLVTSSYGVAPYGGRIAWSPEPDGTTIAFDCYVENGTLDVCTIRVDGTGFGRLTSDPGTDKHPAWSPDGTQIAFSTSRYGTGSEIAVMNADGANASPLGAGVTGHYPTWSPDGLRIAFVDKDASCPSLSCIYTVQN